MISTAIGDPAPPSGLVARDKESSRLRTAVRLAAACAGGLLVAGGTASCAESPRPLPRLAQPAAVPLAAAVAGADGSVGSARTLAEIQALVGAAACGSDAECRVSPVGANPCGGPEDFIAWSTRTTTDEAALQTLLVRYAAQRRQENEASGRMGMCAVLPVPTSRCENAGPGAGAVAPGRCVLVPQRPGASPVTR
jgi:hypothetical protein